LHDRRHQRQPVHLAQRYWLAGIVAHYGNEAIRGTQVYTYDGICLLQAACGYVDGYFTH
jgi:hypothetical protein